MKQKLISYKTKPESVEENKRLIGHVFSGVALELPEGIRYLVLNSGDGSFLFHHGGN